MDHKILVIDDDLGLLNLLRQWLEHEGFTVLTADGGKEGFRKAYRAHPDLIILDIMMPEVDGWVTYRQLRRICNAPIIVLTARAGTDDIAKGLSLGVDDYLTKPYSFDELRVRIHELLGRESRDRPHVIYDDGNLRIDFVDGVSIQREGKVNFSSTESRLLIYLASRKGQAVPSEELLVKIWGPEYAHEVAYLDVYVRYLCHKIEDDPDRPRYIRTRPNVGYYFGGNGASSGRKKELSRERQKR